MTYVPKKIPSRHANDLTFLNNYINKYLRVGCEDLSTPIISNGG